MKTGKWDNDETEYLLENYKTKTDREIANDLDREELSVRNKRINLKLDKNIMTKKNIVCKNCRKDFAIHSSRKNAKFCSRECKGEFTKKISGSMRICIICKNEFYATGNPKGRHICSRECFYKYQKNGETITCDNCGKDIYKSKGDLKRSKNLFCSTKCANEFQKCEKINLYCKVCCSQFEVYPSTIKHSNLRNNNVQYCSLECRDKDPERLKLLAKLNNKQNRNIKRNKLELEGNRILDELNILYEEQYLVNNKISVDVFIPKYNLIIEWWGDYWHGHPSKIKNGEPDKRQKKRMALDISQSQYLKKCGYTLLTFWEHEVYLEKDMVKKKVKDMIDSISF